MRLALRLSWLEIRSPWRLRRHAVRTRRHHAAGESEAPRLPRRRKGGRGLGLYGAEGTDSARARLRMDPRAGKAPLRVQDLRELQLAAGARRRARHLAL